MVLPANDEFLQGATVAGGTARSFDVMADGTVRTLDAGTNGIVLWNDGDPTTVFSFAEPARDYVVVEGDVVVVTAEPWRLVRLTSSGPMTEMWHVDLPDKAGTVAASRDWVFVTLPRQNEVVKIDAGTGEIVTAAPTDAAPWSLAADEDGVYVGALTAQTVAEFDPVTMVLRDSHTITSGVYTLLLDGDDLYVAGVTGEKLVRLSRSTGEVTGAADLGSPSLLAATGAHLVVGRYGPDPALLVLDRDDLTTTQRVIHLRANLLGLKAAGGDLYVSIPEENRIVRVR